MKPFLWVMVFLLSPALAVAADYAGESGYQQFKTCNSWLQASQSYKRRIKSKNSKIDSLAGQINRMADNISGYKSDMDSAERWLSIQEAAGDNEGANRSVSKFNNARRKAINLTNRRDDLIDQHNDLIGDIEGIESKLASLSNKATRYCVGKTWERKVIDRACGTYSADTSDYCEYFD